MEKALSVKWDKLKKLNEPNKLNKLFTPYELRFTLHGFFTSAFRILTSALLCRYHESRTRITFFAFYGLRITLNENNLWAVSEVCAKTPFHVGAGFSLRI